MPNARFATAVLGLLAALLANAPAAAQPAPPPIAETGDAMVLATLGHSLKLPLPDWLDPASGAAAPQVDTVYQADDAQAVLQIFPKGQQPALWKTLYGARVTLETGRTLKQYRQWVMAGYARTCRPERTGFFQLGPDNGDDLATLGFVCGAYRPDLPGYGGEGEVMIMSFRRSEDAIAVVYQEWRGSAFDPTKPATWPVDTEIVEARAAEFEAEAAFERAQ